MAWVQSHQSLSRHRKTLRAAAILKVDRHKLIGHLHEMWWWAIDNVPIDGNLAGLSDLDIATGAQWKGDPTRWISAMTESGFIDADLGSAGTRVLHDWYDYAGKLNELRVKERERSRYRRHASTGGQPKVDRQTTVGRVPDLRVPDLDLKQPPLHPPAVAGGNGRLVETVLESTRKTRSKPAYSRRFEIVWRNHPNGKGKGSAWRAWLKAAKAEGGEEALYEQVKAAMTWQLHSEQWAKDHGQFVPMLATYLNGRRWEDKPEGAL